MPWAKLYAVSATYALGVVDTSKVIGKRNSVTGTIFSAFATADTAVSAHAHYFLTFTQVRASNVHDCLIGNSADQLFGASADTNSTASAQILVHRSNRRVFVNVDCIVRTGVHTRAKTHTAYLARLVASC